MLKVGWDWLGGDRSGSDDTTCSWTPEDCGCDPWPAAIDAEKLDVP